MPTAMLKAVYSITERKKNIELVNMIKSGLSDLKNKIENISEDQIRIGKPYEILDIVKKILEFNKQNQEGQGLKVLTSSQLLSKLPISLAQLRAGNNSGKPKNEIRQLLHSLNCSNKLTKTIYSSLKKATVFMNTDYSKSTEPHRFRLTLADKLNLKDPSNNMALANLRIFYTWKNI